MTTRKLFLCAGFLCHRLSLLQAILVLGGSFLSEGGSCLVALNETRKNAKAQGMSYLDYSECIPTQRSNFGILTKKKSCA